ncbi:MAG TPA: ATP-grasp domain-containing protein, partial [Streptosporangiaceae bacterium]|nr:ATP-grasp domain-containing protein [Streptosporangiaceae bacterium]
MSDQAEVAATAPPEATAAARRTVPVVGMIGAGQLARMTSQAATGLGIGFRVLAASPADSAALVCQGTRVGDYRSADDLAAFAAGCDVVTFDHEQVPAAALAGLARSAAAIRPGPAALRFTQDKRAMREWLTARGIACPEYAPVSTAADTGAFAGRHGWPVVLKAVSGGYDGRGVWVCGDAAEAAAVLAGAAARGIALLAEQHVAF